MKFFLVLMIYGNVNYSPAITVVPVPFNHYQTCIDAGKKWKTELFNRSYECVEHPMQSEGMPF